MTTVEIWGRVKEKLNKSHKKGTNNNNEFISIRFSVLCSQLSTIQQPSRDRNGETEA